MNNNTTSEELSQSQIQKNDANTVIRVVHNRENPYVLINKTALRDKRISLRAAGLWARCLSYPNDWKFSIKQLASECKEGKCAIYSTMKELIEYGYVLRIEYYEKGSDGKFMSGRGGIEYIFFEFPATEEEKQEQIEKFKKSFRNSGFGNPGCRVATKSPLLSNDNIPTRLKESDRLNKEEVSEPSVRLIAFFMQKLKEINPKIREPNIVSWQKEMNRILNIDGRSEQEVTSVINYIIKQHANPRGEFTWSKAVMSPEKLRKHFASIWMEMNTVIPSREKEKSNNQQIQKIESNRKWAREFYKKIDGRLPMHLRLIVSDNHVTLINKDQRINHNLGYLENGFQSLTENFFRKFGGL